MRCVTTTVGLRMQPAPAGLSCGYLGGEGPAGVEALAGEEHGSSRGGRAERCQSRRPKTFLRSHCCRADVSLSARVLHSRCVAGSGTHRRERRRAEEAKHAGERPKGRRPAAASRRVGAATSVRERVHTEARQGLLVVRMDAEGRSGLHPRLGERRACGERPEQSDPTSRRDEEEKECVRGGGARKRLQVLPPPRSAAMGSSGLRELGSSGSTRADSNGSESRKDVRGARVCNGARVGAVLCRADESVLGWEKWMSWLHWRLPRPGARAA